MSIVKPSGSAARPGNGVRLTKRLERSDPFLMRAVKGIAMIGGLLGVLVYAWQVIQEDTVSSRRALDQAATVGQVAAEADVARINAVAMDVSPRIAASFAAGLPASKQRSLQADMADRLVGTPVMAIIVFGEAGQTLAVLGQMPSDAAGNVGPRTKSRRAGEELLDLELVPIAKDRVAYYRDLPMGNGKRVQAAMVLRASAFQPALQMGSAAGMRWRAALLNRDGETILTAADEQGGFTERDVNLAGSALGWRALHGDESAARDRVTGQSGDVFIETRSVSGDMLQLTYVGQARPALSVLVSHRFEFLALFGVSMIAVLLAVSVIQNEWQRQDRQVRDADLATARAEITCDLLAAGVIDWSVSDGAVEYSEGWADMFGQGDEPVAEQIFDWIARIHQEDKLAAREAYQAMLEGRETELVHRIRIRMSSGLWVQVVERGRALVGTDGRTKRIVLVQTTEPVDGSALRNAFGGAMLPTARAV